MHLDSNNNSLSIRLTEPVVPLRSTPPRASPHHDDTEPNAEVTPPAVVRGLLTLRLSTPTKISSIELCLQAKASTRYTRGTGPDRVDVAEQYNVYSTSTVVFQADPAPAPQLPQHKRPTSTSTGPRVQFYPTASEVPQSTNGAGGGDEEALSGPVTRSMSFDPQAFMIRNPQRDQIPMDPTPPYPDPAGQRSFLSSYPTASGRPLSVASNSGTAGPPYSAVLSRNSPTWDTTFHSSSFSAHSTHDLTLSRASSIEEVPESDGESSDSSALCPDDGVAYYGLSRVAASSSSHSPEQGRSRGRSHSRLPFGKVIHMFDAVKDRLRSRSPRSKSRPLSNEQEERGRSLFNGKGKLQVSAPDLRDAPLGTKVYESLGSDRTNDDQSGHGWVMFPAGTYSYPIFFTIPHSSPPTMKAEHGSLIWKVKSDVKQPSTVKWKMTAQKEVIVVCGPKDDDSEEPHGIDLQRQWDGQFQYRMQIAECSFSVGEEVPFELTIMPLAKFKVHGISAYLDERTEYYSRGESQAQSDAIRRNTLLVIKHNNSDERYSEPILPLTSDERDAFHKSPLYRFVRPGDNESEMASSFMGAGPWTIRHPLRIPDSCLMLHPSNRAKGSNVMVSHTLKIVLRVEKEEGTGMTGRKKLYDVVIHAPIQILSCRCTSIWASLPRYEEALQLEVDSAEDVDTSMCPCRRNQAKAQTHSHATDALPAPMGHITSLPMSFNLSEVSDVLLPNSLAGRTHLHERLMSGLVSERGEAPPSYDRVGAVYV